MGCVSIVENRSGTTLGGVTGRGFLPGQSGNPGGRPKGLAKRVRELVGTDGEAIVAFMAEVMNDETARNADRIEAAKWLGDRGFGRAVQALDIDVNRHDSIDLTKFSLEDLKALIAIVERYEPETAVVAESGEIHFDVSRGGASSSRQR
jgi:hypothetical protein